ncbi:MAG: AEC family transporter [Clostridiales bacterium]|nr:AEC family transporter [Hornefia butyriciproducens]MCI7679190.1 AEC family transporter [Clostridiales bacterium]MDY2990489.1 AEC family transporter [Hornefia butyriciproducens]MDY5462740.1 AEC family transporter [Hornefia butyriciproducens]
MNNLIFCLNAVVPIFLLMLLGMFFMRIGIFDDAFVSKMNSFVFRVALPALVFYDLCSEDFGRVWDLRFVLFCFLATLVSILLCVAISCLLRDRRVQGEFIQVSYRSSAAILGVSLVTNLYGTSGMTPLMMLGAVPLYNAAAVVVLTIFTPERNKMKRTGMNRAQVRKTAVGIITNPILIGIFAGLLWSVLRLPMGSILDHTVQNLARLATPLGIMAMGASFNLKKALSGIRTAGLGAFIKLIGLGLIFVPLAVTLGFRQDRLVAILIMCCSCSTVSCYVMAREMGHEGTLTSSTVMLTTFFSAFTLTGWLFVLKTLGLL